MKVIQNFTSNTHYKTIPLTDIIIWSCCLQNLKVFNHKTKLYCRSTDISFLKEWNLYSMYDEIDTEFLDNWESPVDETNFWSTRKLACIEHEFKINSDQFIYMDTDVIINMPLYCPSDILVWGLEPEGGVYIPWEELSLPENYKLPEWLKDTKEAYNCGVLAFKSKDIFTGYLQEYYKFTLNNPCIISSEKNFVDTEKRAIWACNAEQRLLTGYIDYLGLEPTAVNIDPHQHISESGIHYYILRHNWRLLADWSDCFPEEIKKVVIYQLNKTIRSCLSILFPEKRNFLLSKSPILTQIWEKDLEITDYI